MGLRVLIRTFRANPPPVRGRGCGHLPLEDSGSIDLAEASLPRCELPSSRRARTRPCWRYPAWSRIRRCCSDAAPMACRPACGEDQPPQPQGHGKLTQWRPSRLLVPPVDACAANPGAAGRSFLVLYPLVCSSPVPPGEPPARLVRRILWRDAVVHCIHRVVDEAVRGRRRGKGRDRRPRGAGRFGRHPDDHLCRAAIGVHVVGDRHDFGLERLSTSGRQSFRRGAKDRHAAEKLGTPFGGDRRALREPYVSHSASIVSGLEAIHDRPTHEGTTTAVAFAAVVGPSRAAPASPC